MRLLCVPWDFDVRRIDTVSNHALSSRTLRVLVETRFLSTHHAGEGHGVRAIRNDEVIARQCAVDAIEGSQRVWLAPGLARRTMIFCCFRRDKSKACRGCPRLHQHIIRDIGNVVDGPLANRFLGDGLTCTFCTTRPQYRAQRSGSEISIDATPSAGPPDSFTEASHFFQ